MKKKINILHFDNNEFNANLIESKIELSDVSCEFKRVFKKEDYLNALMTDVFDIVLCDYPMPDIDCNSALQFAREIAPHTSIVLVFLKQEDEKVNDEIKYYLPDFFQNTKLDDINPVINRAVSAVESHDGISCYWG